MTAENVLTPGLPERRLISDWNHPDFLKLWLGQSVSLVGSRVSEIAIPLTAVLTLQATPAQVGVLAAMVPAAWLLMGLPAGAWVDRQPRRPVMIAADSGRAILLALIPLLAVLHSLSIEALYIVAFANGLLAVFFAVSYQSLLPSLTSHQALLARNSNLEASKSFAEIVGPGIAGFLVGAITAPLAILVDAASFLVSVATVRLIRIPEPPPTATHQERNLRREITEGLVYTRDHAILRAMMLFMGMANLFVAAGTTVYPIFVVRELAISPDIYGLILAIGSIGALIGAMSASPIVRKLGLGRTVLAAGFITGISYLLIPLATGEFVVLAGMLLTAQAIFAAAITTANINLRTLLQVITPAGMLGRINATQRVIISGAPLIGALLGGLLGEVIGLRGALFVAAAGQIVAAGWLLLSPIVRLRTIADAKATGTRIER